MFYLKFKIFNYEHNIQTNKKKNIIILLFIITKNNLIKIKNIKLSHKAQITYIPVLVAH